MKKLIPLVSALCLAAGMALAQAPNPILASTQAAKDLVFPPAESALPTNDRVEAAIYKPDGAGPFPALVLFPGCGGFRGKTANGDWQNTALLNWARAAVAHGYVAMLVDTMTPRGVASACFGTGTSGLNNARSVRDALQAAEHLRTFAYVDAGRIGFVGFSWGGTKALLLSSRLWAASLAPGSRFAAAVAVYPDCYPARPNPNQTYEVVRPDIDRPLLVLMAGKDTETPPATCLPGLEAARQAGAPVEWFVYESATHCWDCRHLHNNQFKNLHGNSVIYLYNQEITKNTEERIFAFLDGTLAPRR